MNKWEAICVMVIASVLFVTLCVYCCVDAVYMNARATTQATR